MDPISGLATARVAVGTVSLLSPTLAARLFRLDAKANPQLPYMSRLFGSREIALGALTLMAGGEARRQLVKAGVAVDGADAFAALAATVGGAVTKPTGVLLMLPAVAATATGIAALEE